MGEEEEEEEEEKPTSSKEQKSVINILNYKRNVRSIKKGSDQGKVNHLAKNVQ